VIGAGTGVCRGCEAEIEAEVETGAGVEGVDVTGVCEAGLGA
jgi:hypothetical protein